MERARLYDGKQAQPRDVLLDIAELDLRLFSAADNTPLASWVWADVTVLNAPGGGLQGMLSNRKDPDSRLVVAEDVWAAHIAGRVGPEEKLPGAPVVAVLALMTIVFIAAMAVASPRALDLAARNVPEAWEAPLGDMALAQMAGGNVCTGTPVARNALARLAKLMDEEHRDFDVVVVNDKVMNAFSLPGRHIILYDELLRRTPTPEQLTGVIAHEVGHAHYRHPVRLFAQTAGGGLLLGLAFGDTAALSKAVSAAHQIYVLKGSREFELQADAYGALALARNGIDPSALMLFLEYMAKQMPEIDQIPQWMSNHPITKERVEDLKQQVATLKNQPHGYAPLSPAEWTAIRNYCRH